MLKACRASTLADRPLLGGDGPPRLRFASKRLRRRVLHQCSHMGAKTWGRIQLDRCCLVIRMHKMKKFAPNFDCYVERLDWPTAPQHPHRGRDSRRRASLSKVVICERKNNRTEFDGPGKLRRWEGYHAPQRSLRAATRRLLVDEKGICTRAHDDLLTVMLQTNRILANRQCARCEAFHTGLFFLFQSVIDIPTCPHV